MSNTKKITVILNDEIKNELNEVKKERYLQCTREEMLRDLILRGIKESSERAAHGTH